MDGVVGASVTAVGHGELVPTGTLVFVGTRVACDDGGCGDVEGADDGTSEFVGSGSSCVPSEGDQVGALECGKEVGERACGNVVGKRVVTGSAVGLRVFSVCDVGLSEGRLVTLGVGLAVAAAVVGLLGGFVVGGFVVGDFVVGGFVMGGFVVGGGTLTGLHTKRAQWHKSHRAHWFSLSERQPPEGFVPEYDGGPA